VSGLQGTVGRDWLHPDWPTPARVEACVTTRNGGVSRGPYRSLNLGDHVGDHPRAVAENRGRLVEALGLAQAPAWLEQVHATRVVAAENARGGCQADAVISRSPGPACVVLTADCLPVLLCEREGACVAAAHAGWRGLAAGVLEATVAATGEPPAHLMAWLGPAIGPRAYEVGPEVRDAFVRHSPRAASAFEPAGPGHWLADLYALARERLRLAGVQRVYGGGLCTFRMSARFFSYRRDGTTGRMASLVWIRGED